MGVKDNPPVSPDRQETLSPSTPHPRFHAGHPGYFATPGDCFVRDGVFRQQHRVGQLRDRESAGSNRSSFSPGRESRVRRD